ncbi:hypothetical protein JN11_02608 [Mucilaginibacter frigoritolerans]|jgi:hypothetical protein|uniref:PKD/Chitinase domain-containing protein n=1 Tax=Mucilaginibacter frigoritolerans TaxID=652788 RepID=A0A562U0A9_9SPHI|nr:DNRLRE domain-containing protein [Mucilaginibacter frigoritolerans]TWI99291.1 hypothetical protein JN11_02608 [Mucilaginibacter frigoritolerans]
MSIKHCFFIYCCFIIFIINGCTKNDNPAAAIKPVAKAPVDTTITLPVNSVTLAGKGTATTGLIVAYLWSQVSGPAEASMVNEGSAVVTINGLIAGKYLFQFMVTDSKGLTGVDTVSVTVNQGKTVTLNLSPSNNPTEFNLGLLGSQDLSNPTSIEEPLCAWTINGVPVTLRDLLKFDLSSIPQNATILKADLYLYSDTIPKNGDLIHANFGADNSVLVQQAASAWDASTLNWFNQPAGLTSNQVIIPSTNQPFLNVDVNVTSIVSSMVNNNANYGFKLSVQNEVIYTSRIFCSSYYTDATRHPRIIITYK